jgi:hypothetical protein
MVPLGVGVVIVLGVHYVSLITCCSAKDDAEGAQWVLHGPRGVIRIMQEVIDKAGLNRLLVPYQPPFLSSPPHNSYHKQCLEPSVTHTLFPLILSVTRGEPSCLPPNAITGASSVSKGGRPSIHIPTPLFVYHRSVISCPGDNMFEDLYLNDM